MNVQKYHYMILEEVKQLAALGFSADQIIKLSEAGFKSSVEAPIIDPVEEHKAPVEEPILEPIETLKVEPTEAPKIEGVSMTDEQFTALLQKMNVNSAGIDVPPTYDLKKVLADHYTEVMVGK